MTAAQMLVVASTVVVFALGLAQLIEVPPVQADVHVSGVAAD